MYITVGEAYGYASGMLTYETFAVYAETPNIVAPAFLAAARYKMYHRTDDVSRVRFDRYNINNRIVIAEWR